jgi:TRAP transporter TAXI family solute receptor
LDSSAPVPKTKIARFSDSWREWLKIGLPVLLLTAVAFAVAWHFVQPAPPKHVVIATGSSQGTYYQVATRYADYFAANGVDLQVKETGGSVENYRLLTSPDSGVDIAIVQSGSAPPVDQRPHVQAVAGIYYEPVWVFYRGDSPINQLSQLAGKKIAVGPEGSGVRQLALMLLDEAGVSAGNATLSDLAGDNAAGALGDGRIDAAFYVIAPTAPVIAKLFDLPGVHPMNFEQAHAYGRRHSFLSPITLYQGSIDIHKNQPQQDLQLVAPSATLVARDSTHEAIIQLLVGAARQTNSDGTLLSDPGTFPTADRSELPVNKTARHFLVNSPNFLYRTMPFWLASMIDRLLIMLLPLLAVLLPLTRMMPPLYKWKIRRRIYMWYRRVREIDERLGEKSAPAAIKAGRDDLVAVEKELLSVHVPLSYMEELYNLRLHVGYVRSRLDDRLGGTAVEGPHSSLAAT